MKKNLDIHLTSSKHVLFLLSVPLLLLFFLVSDQMLPADYFKPILQNRKEIGRGNVNQLVNEQRWNIIVTSGALVNEVFSGYDLSKAVSPADKQGTNDSSTGLDRDRTPEHKIDYVISKPIETTEIALRSVSLSSHGGNAGPGFNPALHYEIVSIIARRAAEVGIPETERKKLVASYIEMSKVLPQREAQKLIMLKISNKKKQK